MPSLFVYMSCLFVCASICSFAYSFTFSFGYIHDLFVVTIFSWKFIVLSILF